MIEVREVIKAYGHDHGRILALDRVSLDIADGEFVSIVGPSGSGKSTLLNLVGGVESATGGTILVAGRDIALLSDRDLTLFRRREVGFVFQSFNLLPNLTVEENVSLPLILDGARPAEIRDQTEEQLEILGISKRKSHKPEQLSGGEIQRVAIARALVTHPRILLADEPTGSLDSKNAQLILRVIRERSLAQGLTVLMVTHDLGAASHGDRIVAVKDGRVRSEEGIVFRSRPDEPSSQSELFGRALD